jgi:hypothetical protein
MELEQVAVLYEINLYHLLVRFHILLEQQLGSRLEVFIAHA